MTDILHQAFGAYGEPIAWWQMSLRGVLLFLYGLLLLRIGARRMLSRISAFDVLIMVTIGSTLSRSLTGNAPLIPAMAAAATLVLMHWSLSIISFYSRALERLVKGEVRQLVKNGTPNFPALRRSSISEDDLREALRLRDIDELDQVKAAYLERDGVITAIKTS
jgi:uncharacterized membrane protein YcaP (DUF421 family)